MSLKEENGINEINENVEEQKTGSVSLFEYAILLASVLFTAISILTLLGGQIDSTIDTINKPAIYLYPEQPENINIKLSPKIKISIDIPKYHPEKGWNIKAYPNGKVEDIQPDYTNCNEIDSKIFGLEYAKSACKQNNYPYVYWDGFTPIPEKAEGWLVKQEQLESFLKEKLNYVGFNESESDEFLEYWIHKITKQKQDQYFIYFIQGKEIDKYIPMTVTPQPDSINRFYIVVDLDTKKHASPQPQQLEKFTRKGFTLVEWGGTIKK